MQQNSMKGGETQQQVEEGRLNAVNGQGKAVKCSERSRKGSGKVKKRSREGGTSWLSSFKSSLTPCFISASSFRSLST